MRFCSRARVLERPTEPPGFGTRGSPSLGTDDATALAVAGVVISMLDNDPETALSAVARALSLNPSCAAAHYWGAHVHAFRGDHAAATVHANRALRLSPFDPLAFEAHLDLGVAALGEARYDEAASHFAKAVQANPGFNQVGLTRLIADRLAEGARLLGLPE